MSECRDECSSPDGLEEIMFVMQDANVAGQIIEACTMVAAAPSQRLRVDLWPRVPFRVYQRREPQGQAVGY